MGCCEKGDESSFYTRLHAIMTAIPFFTYKQRHFFKDRAFPRY